MDPVEAGLERMVSNVVVEDVADLPLALVTVRAAMRMREIAFLSNPA